MCSQGMQGHPLLNNNDMFPELSNAIGIGCNLFLSSPCHVMEIAEDMVQVPCPISLALGKFWGGCEGFLGAVSCQVCSSADQNQHPAGS